VKRSKCGCDYAASSFCSEAVRFGDEVKAAYDRVTSGNGTWSAYSEARRALDAHLETARLEQLDQAVEKTAAGQLGLA
jgi:hypothetical protein